MALEEKHVLLHKSFCRQSKRLELSSREESTFDTPTSGNSPPYNHTFDVRADASTNAKQSPSHAANINIMVGPRGMGAGTPKPKPVPNASAHNNSNDSTPCRPHHHDTPHQRGNSVALTPAQKLIERYERMSTPPPQSPQYQQTPPALKSNYRTQYVYDYTKSEQHNYAAANANMHPNFLATPDDTNGNWSRKHGSSGGGHAAAPGGGKKDLSKDKDKSPIRQSLKNLFSVLKKGAGGLAKRRPTDELQGYLHQAQLRQDKNDLGQHSSSTVRGNVAVTTGPPSSNNVIEQSKTTATSINANQKKKMSGSLLYLTRGSQITNPETPCPLTWATCSVTLDANKLVVSSFMGELELYVHEIALAKCSDIHSLSLSQLNEEERRLLEEVTQEGDNMKVFEVIFDGAVKRKTEKFAAKSVKERAGWISAIWCVCFSLSLRHFVLVGYSDCMRLSIGTQYSRISILIRVQDCPQNMSKMLLLQALTHSKYS